MAYSAGSVVGATPVGFLIDLFGPEALPISIALGFSGLTAFLFLWRIDAPEEIRHGSTRRHRDAGTDPGLSIRSDLER